MAIRSPHGDAVDRRFFRPQELREELADVLDLCLDETAAVLRETVRGRRLRDRT